MATPTQTDPYAEFQDTKPQRAGASGSASSSADPYADFQDAGSKSTDNEKPKKPGILDTANKAYEGRPAIPMAPTTEYASNLLHRIGSSAGRTAMMIPNMAASAVHAITDEPTLDEAGLDVKERVAKRLLVDPSLQAIETEKKHEEKDAAAGMPHSTSEKVLNRAVSAVPLIGPFVESEGQRAGRGDIAGAAADVAAMELIPRVAKEASPGGRLPGAAPEGESAFPVTQSAAQGTVRGAAKAYNAVRKVAPVVAPIVGAAEGYAHGGLPGMAYGSVTGGTLGKIARHLPEAPESLTRYGMKPILPDESTAAPTAEASPLKPLGTKPIASDLKPIRTPEPVPAESVEVRQARHRLGDVVTDALKSSADPQAPEAMQRLSKATNSQLAELSNDLGIKKPRADAVKSGADWAADDFKRTVKAHGKELAQGKELVLRHIAEKLTPSEIMDHTEYFVNPEAKPIKQMSPATERMMDALELSRESKMAARKSGVPDAQMQSLLAKLNARQLKNLGETLASGEHLPKVSGGSQGADLSPNASGESAASQEAINRTASEKAQGVKYYRLDTRSGKAVPLVGPDRVDATAGDYEEIVKVGKDGMETTLDRGNKARPRLRSSKLLLQ
jgi:hypothetical protein